MAYTITYFPIHPCNLCWSMFMTYTAVISGIFLLDQLYNLLKASNIMIKILITFFPPLLFLVCLIEPTIYKHFSSIRLFHDILYDLCKIKTNISALHLLESIHPFLFYYEITKLTMSMKGKKNIAFFLWIW